MSLSTIRSWLLLALLLLCGCRGSEPRVQISGQILFEGKPLTVQSTEKLRVIFCRLNERNQPSEMSYLATVERHAHFTASLPQGKYRILVRLLHGDRDLFHDAFNAKKSPFVQEIYEGDELNLELPKEQLQKARQPRRPASGKKR
jgi:hypothetical protein